MRKLIYLLIWILLAVTAALFMHQHPAYLFVSFGHFFIQTSLWFAVFSLLLTLFVLSKIWKILSGIYHIPTRIGALIKQRSIKKLSVLTQKGLRTLIEAHWQKSERYFAKGAKIAEYPFFYYMAAAQVAFSQQQLDRAQDYLQKATLIAKPVDQPLSIMMQVRWQLAAQDYQSALTGLLALKAKDSEHPFVLHGLETVYLALQDWRGLDEILPQLGKQSGIVTINNDRDICPFHHHNFNTPQLAKSLSIALLNEAGQTNSLKMLETTWEKLPKKWRKQAALIAIYAARLMTAHHHDKAEQLLKKAISEKKDPLLLREYANITSENPAKQIARVEGWLKEDNQNADLLFCAGALCLKHRLLGKARDYLQSSLKKNPAMNTYLLLGKVFEALQDKTAALDSYKTGLELLRD